MGILVKAYFVNEVMLSIFFAQTNYHKKTRSQGDGVKVADTGGSAP